VNRKKSLPWIAAASTTLSSCVPAWVVQTSFPSAVQAMPQGLPAPRNVSSRPTVLTSFLASTSMTLTTLVFIHPMSTWMGCRSKLHTTCVT
jgi:hypothetical protein